MIKKINELSLVNNLTDYKVTLNPFSNIYGYYIDDEIVGFIDYNIMYENIELNYIFVKEEYRGKNISDELMKILVNEGLKITLEVSILNEKAISLYKKYGFSIISKREKYYNGVDAYLMMKESDFDFINKYNLKDYQINNIQMSYFDGDNHFYNLKQGQLYDIASLTKMFTLNLLYDLQLAGIIDFNKKVSEYLETKLDVTILELLKMCHFIKIDKDLKTSQNYDEFKSILINSYVLEKKDHYNDVGMCFLGILIERVTNRTLEKNFNDLFIKHNLLNTKINPKGYKLLGNGNNKELVNDAKTRIANGITGAAGIFSNVEDLTKYLKKVIDYDIFSKEFIDEVFKYNFIDSNLRNRTYAGLYKYTDVKKSYVKINSKALAHQGFTGTWFLIDFDKKFISVLLTDSIEDNTFSKNINFFDIFHDIIFELTEKSNI